MTGKFNYDHYDYDARHNVCTGTGGYLLEIWYDAFGRVTASKDAAGTREHSALLNIINQPAIPTRRHTHMDTGQIL